MEYETYGETLAGGSFGSWFKDHLGAIGTAAFIGAQFIPGVDVAVDAGAAADVAATPSFNFIDRESNIKELSRV